MAIVHPWGKVEWLFDKLDRKKWVTIASNSFEDRCLALPLKLKEMDIVDKVYCIDVKSPNGRFDDKINELKYENKKVFKSTFLNRVTFFENQLMAQPNVWNDIAREVAYNTDSIVIDITTLPKRVFFFIIKKLMKEAGIKNIIACYTRAESYKEGKLTEDAEPPSALPGFARTSSENRGSLVVVSVGYMSFNLNDYLEQGNVKAVKYLFPFPPGSPSFRRNWHLLHKIAHTSGVSTKEENIKRVHAMDMFSALEWLKEIRAGSVESKGLNMDMIPLGPKTHSLAMALNYLDNEDYSEVVYSQPRLYYPNYSKGIMVDDNKNHEIYAYCLKVGGVQQF